MAIDTASSPAPEREPTDADRELTGGVRHGLLWGAINSLVLRLGSLVVGIVLARLLTPADFGVYAVALTVQSVLLTLADVGMSVDLVRAKDPRRRAPTVATVSVATSLALTLVMIGCSSPVASALGAPRATGVIMALSVTVLISGVGVVPYATLQRDFQQRKLFACSCADFATSTVVTILLVLAGLGPLSLALGRIAAQSVATALQFVFARVRPRFGFDWSIARGALIFGLPLAGANLLSWALLNIDNVVIARVAGTTALGLYVLAFNVSTWPMNAIGQAIRSVSLAGFSRVSQREGDGDRGLGTALSLTWTVALPAGLMLAALAHPLIELLYGPKWSASAVVLAALGIFGAVRVILDLLATYLMARGASRPLLYVNALWFFGLIPAVIAGAHLHGVSGVGWAHVAVAVAVILPAYMVALRRIGVPLRVLATSMWLPTLAAVPMWLVAHLLGRLIGEPLLALAAGGLAGLAVYAAICLPWLRRLLPADALRLRRRRAARIADQPQPEGA